MKRRSFFCGCINLALATLTSGVHADNNTEEGVRVANAWVQVVDHADYAQSWSETSAFFRSVVTEEQWHQAASSVRKPLGTVVTRMMQKATYSTTLPNAPEGQYVVVQYQTDFANAEGKVETLTVMLDDGQWKTTGYFVR